MTRPLIVIAAFLSLAVPTALAVPPADTGKPESPGKSAAASGQSADKNAAKKCKALRKNDATGFKNLYGDKPNAYGKCVSKLAKAQAKKDEEEEEEEEAEAEEQEAHENAAKKCKALRQNDATGFKNLYGDKPNAYGKCVSKLAKAQTSS